MGKSSGGVRGTGGGNYTASVGIEGASGSKRWISKSFRTQKQGEQWIEKVARRFNEFNKSGFAYTASIDRTTKQGEEYDIFHRDLAREMGARYKRGYK